MAQCKCIISSAMHGLIAADSLGIPNVRMILSDKITGGNYKYDDYYSAFGIKNHNRFDLRKEVFTEKDLSELPGKYQIKPDLVRRKKTELLKAFPYKIKGKNMSVKVSVVIPVYNVAPYLTKCMESVSGQTLQDIEIIAVNDASTDNSLTILKKFAKQDSRIQIISHKKNTKTAGCRNDGLDAATGEYVCFLDGDDYLDTDFCEKII